MKIIWLVEKLLCSSTGELHKNKNENNIEKLEFSGNTRIVSFINESIIKKCYIEFTQDLLFDFNHIEQVELAFLIYDNRKFPYQNYLTSDEKFNGLFDSGHIAETDGVLYFGRDLLNEANCREIFLKKEKIKLEQVKELSSKEEKGPYRCPLFNVMIKSLTKQVTYDFKIIPCFSEKFALKRFTFSISGPIKGIDPKSLEDKRVSCIAILRQTDKIDGKKRIVFTKEPLIFKSKLCFNEASKVIYQSMNLPALQYGRKIELNNAEGDKKLLRRVTAGNSLIEYSRSNKSFPVTIKVGNNFLSLFGSQLSDTFGNEDVTINFELYFFGDSNKKPRMINF